MQRQLPRSGLGADTLLY